MPTPQHPRTWWFLLASCGGVLLYLFLAIVYGASVGRNIELLLPQIAIALLEGFGVLTGVLNLRLYYTQHSIRGKGRWQFTLIDMLTIMFFFGIVMWAAQVIHPEIFFTTGLAAAMILGIGFAAAIMVVNRLKDYHSLIGKWLQAIAYFVVGVTCIIIAASSQLLLLAMVWLLAKTINPHLPLMDRLMFSIPSIR